MSERDKRIANLKARIDLAGKEKEVRERIVVSGALSLTSGVLSFVYPVFIGSTLALYTEFLNQTREHDSLEKKQDFLAKMADGK